jgi:hypothetical protein
VIRPSLSEIASSTFCISWTLIYASLFHQNLEQDWLVRSMTDLDKPANSFLIAATLRHPQMPVA